MRLRHVKRPANGCVIMISCFSILHLAFADVPAVADDTVLISETVDLQPGDASEWVGTAKFDAGAYRLAITYGAGGITNEGYTGFPPEPYSIYPQGRGAARLRIRIGNRDIVTVQCPPVPSDPELKREAVVPFVVFEPGEQEIRLSALLGGDDDHVEILAATLRRVSLEPVPHTLHQSRPLRPLMDLVSWCEFVFYTAPPGRSPDDVRDLTLKPAWKAGLNMIWTVFNNPWGNVPFEWDEDATGLAEPETFSHGDDERWQVEGYRRYRKHLAERGMLEMLYYPGSAPGIPTEIGGPGKPASQVKTFDRIINSLLYAPEQLIDGISHERYCATNNSLDGSRELAVDHVNQLLESNPGAAAVNYISGVPGARPGMVGDFPNGLEPYSLGYFEPWDDALLYAPDPWWLELNGGRKYRWIEFWTEDGEFVPEEDRVPADSTPGALPAPYSLYGGHIGEDYIVKQMNDASRLRLLHPDAFQTLSGITWYTDGMIVSDGNIETAYAVSQDPVRGAVAGRLRTLGEGGRIRSLYPYSTESHYLQNNQLALYFPAAPAESGTPADVEQPAEPADPRATDHAELFYDPQRTANFTPSSFSVALTRRFLDRADGERASELKTYIETHVLERGAYRAAVRSERTWGGNETVRRETRTFELISDSPYLLVSLDGDVQGDLVLFDGQLDGVLADGVPIGAGGSAPLPRVAYLSSASDLVPDVAFLFLDAPNDAAFLRTEVGVVLLHRGSAGAVRFALVVPKDLYSIEDLSELADHLARPRQPVGWSSEAMVVTNDVGIPVVDLIELEGADERPYLVEEGGWWTFRGAQKSARSPDADLLKVYLQAGGTATIQPWDFIGGAARPGWGCQYVLALSECRSRSDGASCDVRVLSETPLIFAPRVEFASDVAEARLNGEPWHYFDGANVFLTQDRGDYRLDVVYGQPMSPHISRTYANVTATRVRDGGLTVTARTPPWRPTLPEGLHLTAQIEHQGRAITDIEGGELVRTADDRSIVRITPGNVILRFQ